jgi:hypothetical protein
MHDNIPKGRRKQGLMDLAMTVDDRHDRHGARDEMCTLYEIYHVSELDMFD